MHGESANISRRPTLTANQYCHCIDLTEAEKARNFFKNALNTSWRIHVECIQHIYQGKSLNLFIFSRTIVDQSDYLLSVEQVGNSCKLPIGAGGNTS